MGNTTKFQVAFLAAILTTFAIVVDGQQKPAGDRSDGRKNLEQTLMDLQRQEDEAEGKRDIATLDRLFADNAILVLGKVLTKAEFLGVVRDTKNEALPSSVIKYDEVTVRDYGSTAAVSYKVTYQGKDSSGKEQTNRFLVLVVWVKSENQWRIAAAQAQPLP